MLGCNTVRDQLLDDLYELLDAADHARLTTHLAECPACSTERARLADQQAQIRQATVHHFANVVFTPPTTLPFGRRIAPAVLRFAVAATLLLGILGAWSRYSTYQYHAEALTSLQQSHASAVAALAEQVRTQTQELEQRQAHLTNQREHYRQAQQARDERLAAATQRLQSVGVDALVTGPAQLAPGAPGEFRIDTQTPTGVPAPAQLSVKVHDADQRVVYEQTAASSGRHTLTLPTDLLLGTGRTLDLTARTPSGQVDLRRSLLPPAYRTHLALDRVAYLPGDTVFFRSLTLESRTQRPALADVRVVFELIGPAPTPQVLFRLAGSTRLDRLAGPLTESVRGPDGQPLTGIAAGEFPLPANLPAGTYAVIVRAPDGQFAPQERRLVVRPRPLLTHTVTFDKPSYDAGATVSATVQLLQASGQPAVGVPISGHVIIDNGQYPLEMVDKRTNATGTARVRLQLPPRLHKGSTHLHLAWHAVDGAMHRFVVAAPVRLNKIFVELYPEGGELIANVPNRVYVQARHPDGRPAALAAKLLLDEQLTATELTTDERSGRGMFTFTPKTGVKYAVQGDVPIVGTFPKVQPTGVRLTLSDERTVQITNTATAQNLVVTFAQAGQQVQRHDEHVDSGQTISVAVPTNVTGVLRVTVWANLGTHWQPLAERLIHRANPRTLTVTADVLANGVQLQSRDEHGQAKSAIALVGVVDASVADAQAAAGPAFFALGTPEAGDADWADAQIWLTADKNAGREVDAFLATQGWRRFVPTGATTLAASTQQLNAAVAELHPRLSQALVELDNAQQAWLDARSPEQQERYRVKQTRLLGFAEQLSNEFERHEFRATQAVLHANQNMRLAFTGLASAILILAGWLAWQLPRGERRGLLVGLLAFWAVGTLAYWASTFQPAWPTLPPIAAARDPFADATAPTAVLPTDVTPLTPVNSPKEATPGRLEPLALAPVGLPLTGALAPSAEFRRTFQRAQLALTPAAPVPTTPNVRETVAPPVDKPLARIGVDLPPALPFIIRQYAAPANTSVAGTLYWHPAVVLADGRATVPVPRLPPGAKLFVVAHTTDGRLGGVQVTR
jgi:hypothetical protein